MRDGDSDDVVRELVKGDHDMATVELNWWESSASDGSAIHYCEIKARNDGDGLMMEAHERGRMGRKGSTVTAYFRFAVSQRGIPLYDDEGFSSLREARRALTQWYVENAPTLLVTLAR